MGRPVNAVLADALELSPEEREQVALTLLDSVGDHASVEDVDAAWRAEVERRIGAWQAGRTTARPWAEVLADLRARSSRT